METLFNIVIIFFVLLIAYWWANQGFFSSLLHFVAVVCAGGIALAFWEPIVVNFLLRNNAFDNYAWGVTLIVLFVASLFLIRLAFDRLAPGNVVIPHTYDMIFGGAFGAGSGVLTIGILMIAVGMTQFASSLLDTSIWARSGRGIEKQTAVWTPVHEWTVEFYNFLSAGSFYPDFTRKPLQQVYPELDMVSWNLHRDTFKQGTARTTIPPKAVTVDKVIRGEDRYFVDLIVTNEGYDHSERFVLSSSQIRLIAYRGSVSRGEVFVSHPDQWTQLDEEGVQATYRFDDTSHYVTSIPGQQRISFQVEFPIGNGEFRIPREATPRFLQIKGVRYELPTIQAGQGRMARGVTGLDRAPPSNPNAPMAAAGDIAQEARIQNIHSLSVNNIQGRATHSGRDRLLVEGRIYDRRGAPAADRNTRIQGYWATDGTEIITVKVSRGTTCDIYEGPAREKAGDTAAPKLVDSNGNEYLAKGFVHITPDTFEINLTPDNLIRSIEGRLPHLPTNRTQDLWLIFEVTEGARITSFRLGDVTVANCDLVVEFR